MVRRIASYGSPHFLNYILGRVLTPDTGEIDGFIQSLRGQKDSLTSCLVLHNNFINDRTVRKVDVGCKPVQSPMFIILFFRLVLQQQLNIERKDLSNRRKCQEGTRVEIRQIIIDALRSDKSPNIVWLRGVAGSGKSTIATSIEDYFRSVSQLGAFLKFERNKSNPNSVIRELAYNLALFDSSMSAHVIETVEKEMDIASALLSHQFEQLLRVPLTSTINSYTKPRGETENVIIVLDALDECGTPEDRKELMKLLQDEFKRLPRTFRFLITSRPELDIERSLSRFPDSVYTIELDYTSNDSKNEVRSYLDVEMRRVFDESEQLIPEEKTWVSSLDVLSEVAGGLFIWASTAVRIVETSTFKADALEDLVSDTRNLPGATLGNLYATVLSNSGIFKDTRAKERFGPLMSLLLLSKEPLAIQTIDKFLDFPTKQSSEYILSKLRSVLSYTPGEPVRLLHTSFSDYLQSPLQASEPWHIDIPGAECNLARRCISVMEAGLHFNICNLETSFVRNDDVPDLIKRIEDSIPSHLDYACTYWSHHLAGAPFDPFLSDAVSAFAYHHLLFWLEVMSLKGFNFGVGNSSIRIDVVHALSRAASWMVSSH